MSDDSTDVEGGSCNEASITEGIAKKRRLIRGMFVYAAVLGVIGCFLPEDDSTLDMVLGFPIVILGIMWCLTDARQREQRVGRLMKVALVMLFAVALPIYLLRSRGVRGLVTILQAAAVFAGLITTMLLTETITLYLGSVAGWWEFQLF